MPVAPDSKAHGGEIRRHSELYVGCDVTGLLSLDRQTENTVAGGTGNGNEQLGSAW